MTFFHDLTEYSYLEAARPGVSSARALNVGWLGGGQPYTTGSVPEELLAGLFELCAEPMNRTRGFHQYEFCDAPEAQPGPMFAERGGRRIVLGSAEVRVVSSAGVTYAAPTLIYHYVEAHGYAPPQEFLDALAEFRRGCAAS